MTTGVKIAIGCAVAILVCIIALAAVVGGGLWWAKGKVEQVAGTETRIEELHKKANATPFDRPADGVIREDRLVKFIDVRRRVFVVYEKHKATLERIGQKKQGELSDLTTGFSVINEVRTAQAQALADIGMSEDEYRFMVEQIYKSAWASEIAKSTGGKSVSEAAGEAYEKAASEMEKAQRDAAAAERAAEGTPSEEAAEDAKAQVKKGIEELRRQAGEVRENAREMDAPPANIELFRKYEADIKKYAMGGLEWIGL